MIYNAILFTSILMTSWTPIPIRLCISHLEYTVYFPVLLFCIMILRSFTNPMTWWRAMRNKKKQQSIIDAIGLHIGGNEPRALKILDGIHCDSARFTHFALSNDITKMQDFDTSTINKILRAYRGETVMDIQNVNMYPNVVKNMRIDDSMIDRIIAQYPDTEIAARCAVINGDITLLRKLHKRFPENIQIALKLAKQVESRESERILIRTWIASPSWNIAREYANLSDTPSTRVKRIEILRNINSGGREGLLIWISVLIEAEMLSSAENAINELRLIEPEWAAVLMIKLHQGDDVVKDWMSKAVKNMVDGWSKEHGIASEAWC